MDLDIFFGIVLRVCQDYQLSKDTRDIPSSGTFCVCSGGLSPLKVIDQIDESGALRVVFSLARVYL